MIYEPAKSQKNGWLRPPHLILSAILQAIPGVELKKVPIVFTLDSLHHKNVPQQLITAYFGAWATHHSNSSTCSRRHLWVNPGVNSDTERPVREAGGESVDTWNMMTNATRVREGWYGQRVGLVQAMMVSFLSFQGV